MREPQTKTIDGVTFEVTPLGYLKARSAFVRLMKAVGPALAAAADDAPDMETLKAQAASANLVGAIAKFIDRVSEDDLEWFAQTFGKTTRFSEDGQKWPYLTAENREALFGGGSLSRFFRWLAFALEVNFSDFLALLRSAKGGAGRAPEATPASG